MEKAMIKYCGCTSGSNISKSNGNIRITNIYANSQAVKFQDDLYGKGMRIFTPLTAGKGTTRRCTVCGKEK
jgi:hypothetical protein